MGTDQSQLSELVLNIMRQIDKEATNIITPRKAWWNKMRSLGGGAIETRAPNIHGVTERLLYNTPDQSFSISRSVDSADIAYDTPEGYTEAQYDYIQDLMYLALGKFEMDNTTGEDAIVDHVRGKMRLLEIQNANNMEDRFWNGKVSGSEVVFGLNDVLNRTSMSTDPTKGSIGKIDTSVGLASAWRPKVHAFGAAYKTIDTGNMQTTLLHESATSMLSLWQEVSDNDSGDSGKMEDANIGSSNPGEPDFFICNDVLYGQLLDLIDNRLFFTNKEDRFQTGINEPLFRSATIMYDSKVPTLVSTEGQGFFYNTNAAKFVFAKGLEKSWGAREQIPGKTAWGWPMSTQYTMVYNDLRKLGIMHDVRAAA